MLLNDLLNYDYDDTDYSWEYEHMTEAQREEYDYIESHTVYRAWGDPYWSKEVVPKKTKKKEAADNNFQLLTTWAKITKSLIIIDGDNHIEIGLRGIDDALDNSDVDVLFVCNNQFLANKIIREYNIETVVVPKNVPQATDNRIKSTIGQKARTFEYDYIAIISRDKDLVCWDKSYPEVSILMCESIEEALDEINGWKLRRKN